MATYEELSGLFSNDALRNRVSVAIAIKAAAIIDSTPTADQRAYAESALENPGAHSHSVWKYVLAKNKDATVAQIEGATDSTLVMRVQ